jgi:hypothetical protein
VTALKKGKRTAKHAKVAKKKQIHGFVFKETQVEGQCF